MRRPALLAACALVLALAACGGGGDGADVPEPPGSTGATPSATATPTTDGAAPSADVYRDDVEAMVPGAFDHLAEDDVACLAQQSGLQTETRTALLECVSPREESVLQDLAADALEGRGLDARQALCGAIDAAASVPALTFDAVARPGATQDAWRARLEDPRECGA